MHLPRAFARQELVECDDLDAPPAPLASPPPGMRPAGPCALPRSRDGDGLRTASESPRRAASAPNARRRREQKSGLQPRSAGAGPVAGLQQGPRPGQHGPGLRARTGQAGCPVRAAFPPYRSIMRVPQLWDSHEDLDGPSLWTDKVHHSSLRATIKKTFFYCGTF